MLSTCGGISAMADLWPISEKDFQQQVVSLAILHGWKVHHVRPGMSSKGAWMTQVQGHSGFPDLVLVHPERGVIFAELKALKGRVSENQVDWLRALDATGAETYVWRPTDLDYIVRRFKAAPDAA